MLSMQNISMVYRTGLVETHALREFSLEVAEGEFVSVTGPSGSGKSTLLLTLGGLIYPSSGHIFFRDQALYSSSNNDLAGFRRKHVGFVMQNFSLIPYLSALKNVMIPLSLQKMDKDTQRKRATDLLDSIGLKDRINHLPRELSVGQQQRVAIARAIANNPSLILADEPTGNLDPSLAQEILELLKVLNIERGITIIMVTHSPAAADFGTVRIHLNEGRLIQ